MPRVSGSYKQLWDSVYSTTHNLPVAEGSVDRLTDRIAELRQAVQAGTANDDDVH